MNGRTYYPFHPNNSAKPAISWSSESSYIDCPRKWFNEYSNELLPYEMRRHIKAEKRLIDLRMLTGSAAHDIIDYSIRTYKETGTPPKEQLQDIKSVSRATLQEYSKFSHLFTKAFQSRTALPYRDDVQPIKEIFLSEPVSKEEGARLVDKVSGFVTNFLDSPLYGWLMSEDPSRLMPQPKGPIPNADPEYDRDISFPWYWAGESPVYANYDLIVVYTDSATVIDWKTGKKSLAGEERVKKQLQYYAPFVTAEYGIAAKNITLIGAWIGELEESTVVEADPDFLERRIEGWHEWRKDLRRRIIEIRKNRDLLDYHFPMCKDIMRCKNCKYQSCPGAVRGKAILNPKEEFLVESDDY